jgi:hypothetical protein
VDQRLHEIELVDGAAAGVGGRFGRHGGSFIYQNFEM